MDLYNAHVMIVGGSKGAGAALAEEFASRGSRISVLARASEQLDKVAADTGGLAVPVDLTDLDSLDGLVDNVESQNGPIDVVINIAAINMSGPFRKMTARDLRAGVFTNFVAHMEIDRQLMPRMYERKRGTIGICGSVSTELSMIHLGTYIPAKSALTKFGIDLQRELKHSPIRVPVFIIGAIRGTQLSVAAVQDPVVHHINEMTAAFGALKPEYLARRIVDVIASDAKSKVYTIPRTAAPLTQIGLLRQRLTDPLFTRIALKEADRQERLELERNRLEPGV